MIIDIPIILKVQIDTSNLQTVHDMLVTLRDAVTAPTNKEQLNAIIEPIAQKLQFLEDRKFMIQDAKDIEEERLRLLRSGGGGITSS